ncbi:NlpC/P60 family protein [Roseibium porphyridii]|uniref:NlpC/P60 family protein n=1 Tax=Roseibium porphyridii TaxID=2866279 RepID=A0ABY8FAF7_9HYPH|nr:NlpC/P60 family protein [Roseibium sp. KMA01]WFE92311.1 NlpC/P60 family protein [Roseibium sp. KMA01]
MSAHWTTRYVGTPYRELGRDRAGCDCWGLAVLVYRDELGIQLISYDGDYASVAERAEISALIEAGQRTPDWIKVSQPKPFDIVLFRQGRLTSHVGIVCASGRMLHQYGSDCAKIESYKAPRWQSRHVGTFRHAMIGEGNDA